MVLQLLLALLLPTSSFSTTHDVDWIINNAAPRTDLATKLPTNAHQGRITFFGERFYHVGCAWVSCVEMRSGCANMSYGSCGFNNNNISIYSSSTLENADWRLETIDALPIATRAVGEYWQPNIEYNAATQKYVMFWIYSKPGTTIGVVQSGTADSVAGPYAIASANVSLSEASFTSAELFVDDDDTGRGRTAYVLYSASIPRHGHGNAFVVERLNRDWTNVETSPRGVYTHLYSGEGEVMFKRGGTYYMLFGNKCCFCKQGAGIDVWRATHPLGPWQQGESINPPYNGSSVLKGFTIPTQQQGVTVVKGMQLKGAGAELCKNSAGDGKADEIILWSGDGWQQAPDQRKEHDPYWMVPLCFDNAGRILTLTRLMEFTLTPVAKTPIKHDDVDAVFTAGESPAHVNFTKTMLDTPGARKVRLRPVVPATKMDDEAASCVGYVVSGAGAAEVNGCYVSNSRPDGGSSSISFANRANGIVLSKNPGHRGAWQFLNQSSGKALYIQFTSPTVPSTALPPVSSVPVTVCSSWVWPLGWTCSGKGRPPQPAVTRMGLPPVPPPPLDPPSPPALPPPPPPAMELVMSENFSGSTLNRSRWQVYTGVHHGGIYESDNVVLRNGSLVLRTVAKNQSAGGKEFYVSSGAVNQSGLLEQRYGRWSARVKLPDVNESPGWVLHSSVWLVNKFYDAQRPNSSNSSGYSGCHQEIDIVEQYAAGLVPSMDSTAAGALHASTGTAAAGSCKSICCGPQTYLQTANFHSDFHIFTLDWSATRISVSIDGVAVLDYTESAVLASYTDRQFLALTSCVMNRVPPMIHAGDSFPLEYEIDWVRVYRWKSDDLAIKMDDEEAGSLSRAHVFWASDATRSILSSCALPCGWLASDERGNFVAEGKLGSDLTVHLPPPVFGVGFYRIQFSRPEVNGTTAAILQSPESGAGQWPMQATPVAIDTAQAWLVRATTDAAALPRGATAATDVAPPAAGSSSLYLKPNASQPAEEADIDADSPYTLPGGMAGMAHVNFTKTVLGTHGAVCLDGSPGAYYFRAGSGTGTRKWYVHFEGGGWCTTPRECASRAMTMLGSSTGYPQTMVPYQDRGYMNSSTIQNTYFSTDRMINPQMYNWNSVFLRYCDGTSFSGANITATRYGNSTLHFRGSAVQDAIIAHLQKNRALASATDLVVGGASAGGLAVYLHADRWRREAGGAAQPAGSMRVTAMADSGFFLRADDALKGVAGGGFNAGLSPGSYESDMRAMVEMANSSGGLNRACVAAKGKHAADCVFAQVSALFLQTPTFALQSAYDSWQISNIMAPKAASSKLNASLVNAFGNRLRKQLHATLLKETRHGAFIDACEHHCFDWGNFKEHGDNQAAAFAAWYKAGRGARRVWEEPDAFPCTACCNGKQ